MDGQTTSGSEFPNSQFAREATAASKRRRGRPAAGLSIGQLPQATLTQLNHLADATALNTKQIDAQLRLCEQGVKLDTLCSHVKRRRRALGFHGQPGRPPIHRRDEYVDVIAAPLVLALEAMIPGAAVDLVLRRMVEIRSGRRETTPE